ncbi:hypothetical protein LINPERHAP1_LOCUS25020 [Linum perenne]
MRERVRFRERNRLVSRPPVSGSSERGGECFGGVSSQVRRSRLLQSRSSSIAFESSDGRFDSICRLIVSRGPLSHFVFLDRDLLVWLESVLQVASLNRWKLLDSCNSSSARRSLKVSSFTLRGSPVLKIAESCAEDKTFFVLIPSASSSTGWPEFLRLTQCWIADLGILPPPPAPIGLRKSFAQVVSGAFPDQGRCVATLFGSSSGVLVEDLGVDDRRSYLDCCIVFRFLSSERIDWVSFRRWAHRNWGTPIEASFQKLGDGLWLLHCDSLAKVERILSLDRWLFGQIAIQLDKWIPEAGRSGVLLGNDVVWVTIRGIPIHLRSPDLFRQLGDICGEFVSFDAGDSLSSVRMGHD